MLRNRRMAPPDGWSLSRPCWRTRATARLLVGGLREAVLCQKTAAEYDAVAPLAARGPAPAYSPPRAPPASPRAAAQY